MALWVSRVDPGAVRNTANVDLLVRRDDVQQIISALESVGFVHRNVAGLDVFLDDPHGWARDGIHLIFVGELVRPGEAIPNPALTESEEGPQFQVVALRALVGIQLTAFRDKDPAQLRDMIEVGLIDASFKARFPYILADRLQMLIDTPGG